MKLSLVEKTKTSHERTKDKNEDTISGTGYLKPSTLLRNLGKRNDGMAMAWTTTDGPMLKRQNVK